VNLATICNTICSDEPNYEKAFKIFQEYCNQARFKERVVSGQELNVLQKIKGREMPRIWSVRKMSSYWSCSGWKRKRAESEFYKKFI